MIISPAMLKTFEECQQKYFYAYVEKINMPQNKYFFEKGKKIHAIASYYIKGYDVKKLETALTDNEKNLWNYLKSTKYFEYEFLKSEYQISSKLNDCWIGGRLDAFVKNQDDYYILDYKTGSIPENPEYDYQTMVYLLCADKLLKNYKSLNFVYLDLKNKKEEKIKLTKKLKEEYIKKLTSTLEKINLTLESNCRTLRNNKCNCNYNKICNNM